MTPLITSIAIKWDSAPVRQSFGECRVVFDGMLTATTRRGQTFRYRVNISATRGGRKPEAILRYMTEAKRGHMVPENQLAELRAFAVEQAALHLVDYRAAYVAECRERDSAVESRAARVSARFGTEGDSAARIKAAADNGDTEARDYIERQPLKLHNAEALSADVAPVRVIDVTPTWRAILPLLRAAVENGTAEGRKIAWQELERMADAADKWNAAAADFRNAKGESN